MSAALPIRQTRRLIATSPDCGALRRAYADAVASGARQWTDVEPAFLRAVWEFDRKITAGSATRGDRQNGRRDLFTDLIALLLENSSGRSLCSRGAVPGLIFRRHNPDAYYPPEGRVELLIETMVAGGPKSDRNSQQKGPLGRPGSADLKRTFAAVGLRAIDLKAAQARLEGREGGPAADLGAWLRRNRPACFVFFVARVVDARDLEKTIEFAQAAGKMIDGVGLSAYQPDSRGTAYQSLKVPTSLELDRELSHVATALRNLKT